MMRKAALTALALAALLVLAACGDDDDSATTTPVDSAAASGSPDASASGEASPGNGGPRVSSTPDPAVAGVAPCALVIAREAEAAIGTVGEPEEDLGDTATCTYEGEDDARIEVSATLYESSDAAQEALAALTGDPPGDPLNVGDEAYFTGDDSMAGRVGKYTFEITGSGWVSDDSRVLLENLARRAASRFPAEAE